MSRTNSVLIAAVGALGLVTGCGGDDKPANTGGMQQCPPGQYFDGRICQTQGAPAGTAPAPAAGPAPAGTAPGAALPVATTTTGPNATPLDPTAAQAATQLIQPLATVHAMPGAKPVGSALAGNFQQGQSLEAQVQMNPGKCYTIVGVGVPTITDLNIALVPTIAIPGMPAATAAADSTVGPNAIVGEKPNCFKWALPVGGMMKIVMTVAGGQGVAAAQLYEK